MTTVDYSVLISYKVRDVLSLVMNESDMCFTDAILYLFSSQLYACLQDEDSKLWHLSAYKLNDILKMEKENSILVLPDFV